MFGKKAQAEVITTVLLIFIGIVAIIVLSSFVINFVKDHLNDTGCFESVGQLDIIDGEYTKYDSKNSLLYINVRRSTKEMELTSLSIIFGNNLTEKKIKFNEANKDKVFYVDFSSSGSWANQTIAPLPEPGLTQTYRINISSYNMNITKVSLIPIIKDKECDPTQKKDIPTVF